MQSLKNIITSLPQELTGFESHLKMAPYLAKQPNFKELESNSRQAAVSIVLYQKQGEIFFPLIKRPSYSGHHSAQISFPGGKIEKEDTSLYDTAIRETEEEIGIKRSLIQHIQDLSKIYIPPSKFIVSPYLTYVQDLFDFIPDKIEVDRILEVRLKDLLDERNLKTKKIKHSDSIIIDTPYFSLNEEIVWGATAMILSEFKDIIKNES